MLNEPVFTETAPTAPLKSIQYGTIGLLIPVIATLLMILFVLLAGATQYPGTRLFKIVLITVMVSALLTLLGSQQFSASPRKLPDSAFSRLTPITWFILTLLCWPIAFPAYYRTYYSDQNKTVGRGAWAAAGIFLFVVVLSYWTVMVRRPQWSPLNAPAAQAPPISPPAPVQTSQQPAPTLPPPSSNHNITPQPFTSTTSSSVPTAAAISSIKSSTPAPAQSSQAPIASSNSSQHQSGGEAPAEPSYGLSVLPGKRR